MHIFNNKTDYGISNQQILPNSVMTLSDLTRIEVLEQFVTDIRNVIESGLRLAYSDVSRISLSVYWNIGKRIVEEEQQGSNRAKYGAELLKKLSKSLLKDYGEAYSLRNLQYMRQFYMMFPDFEIVNTRVHNLSWSHYRMLLRVADDNARYWYLKEADAQMWSVRTLSRNIGSQYYYRLLQTPHKDEVIKEMQELTAPLQNPVEYLKNPIVAEFLNMKSSFDFKESELEKAIVAHIKEFLLELGKGFAFVAEQQHIVTDTEDYYIDLVFYNYILKCFVLIDLKTTTITHQDVGQMDMYVRMYDDLKRQESDNPTIGLLLCAETSSAIAKYSVLHDSKQLFASKYLTWLPSKEELEREIEKQKAIFRLQHSSD